MTTEAQRLQRKIAGRKSAAKHRLAPDGADGDQSAPLPQTKDAAVDAQIEAYTKLVGKPQSWPDVKTLEQVRGEILNTRAKARADAIESNHLFTRDQIRQRDEWLAETIKRRLRDVADLVARYAPPEQKQAAQKEAQAWADGVLTGVADAVKQQGGKP